MIIRFCKVCNKEFKFRASPSDIKNNRGRYCSMVCVNKDRVFTKETISKMSKAKMGYIPWNKGLKGFRAGPKSHLWKGGITPAIRAIRTSFEYRQWRDFIFKNNNYTCKLCGKRGGNMNADHIRPFSIYIEDRFNLNNGRLLCEKCHRSKTSLDYKFIKGIWPKEILESVTKYVET